MELYLQTIHKYCHLWTLFLCLKKMYYRALCININNTSSQLQFNAMCKHVVVVDLEQGS